MNNKALVSLGNSKELDVQGWVSPEKQNRISLTVSPYKCVYMCVCLCVYLIFTF